jgi:hypothetical protein
MNVSKSKRKESRKVSLCVERILRCRNLGEPSGTWVDELGGTEFLRFNKSQRRKV